MVAYIKPQKDTKKHYRLCSTCNTPVADILRMPDRENSIVTVNLNSKRHICSGPQRIIHEENIVKALLRHIKNINELELSSFQLRLIIEEATT
jgi:hypothetical protein